MVAADRQLEPLAIVERRSRRARTRLAREAARAEYSAPPDAVPSSEKKVSAFVEDVIGIVFT